MGEPSRLSLAASSAASVLSPVSSGTLSSMVTPMPGSTMPSSMTPPSAVPPSTALSPAGPSGATWVMSEVVGLPSSRPSVGMVM